MFKKMSNNLIFFGIVAMSFVLTNSALASSDVTYAFTGDRTGNVFESAGYNNSYINNNPYLYNIGNTNYAASRLNDTTGINTKTSTNTSTQNPTVVNNYYYNTPAPTTSSSTVKSTNSSTNNTTSTTSQKSTTVTGAKVASATNTGYGTYSTVPLAKEVGVDRNTSSSLYGNSLGASAYGATSYRAVSFLPNTFFGWLALVLLIMAIVVVYRLIVRKNRKEQVAVKA